jgi:prevent-host-death family protein
MTITASALRNDIYRLLDRVAETGDPLVVSRKGHLLKIVSEKRPGKLMQLTRHECIQGNADDLVHMDWSGEWSHDLP